MTNAAYTRLKPRILNGRRLLLTAFVTPNDEYFEPADGWVDPVEIALYGNQFGCNLATATGDKRYIDSFERDELLWTMNSILQNVQLRQELGFTQPNSLDLDRLAKTITRFTKACVAIYRHNHPPVTIGSAIIPAHGIQLVDLKTNLPLGALSRQQRVLAQTMLEEGADQQLIAQLKQGLMTK